MKIKWIGIIVACLAFNAMAQPIPQDTIIPEEYAKITTDRIDQRYISSRGVTHALLKRVQPACAFNPDFNLAEFKLWQQSLRDAMAEIMHHP